MGVIQSNEPRGAVSRDDRCVSDRVLWSCPIVLGLKYCGERKPPALSGSASSERPHRGAPALELEGEIGARRGRPGRGLKAAERLDARKLRGKPRYRGAAADEQDRQRRSLAERTGQIELVIALARVRPGQQLLGLIASVVGQRGDVVARVAHDGARA